MHFKLWNKDSTGDQWGYGVCFISKWRTPLETKLGRMCGLSLDIKFPHGEKWFYVKKVGMLVLMAGFFYISKYKGYF